MNDAEIYSFGFFFLLFTTNSLCGVCDNITVSGSEEDRAQWGLENNPFLLSPLTMFDTSDLLNFVTEPAENHQYFCAPQTYLLFSTTVP